jgi:hypothetical protein
VELTSREERGEKCGAIDMNSTPGMRCKKKKERVSKNNSPREKCNKMENVLSGAKKNG